MKLVPQATAPKIQIPGTKPSSYSQNAKALFNKNLTEIQSGNDAKLLADAGVVKPELRAPEQKTILEKPYSPEVTNTSAPSADESHTTEGSSESVEASAAATPEAPKAPEEPLSSQFAALARKEKAMRARVQAQQLEMKAREAALVAREEALKAKDSEYQTKYIPKDRIQNDTLNALAESGMSYDQITELMLAQQNGTANPVYDNKIKALEAKIQSMMMDAESSKKSFEEQQKTSYNQALSQIEYDVKRATKGNAEFETIDKTGSHKDVVELIEMAFNEGLGDEYPKGTVLDIYEAAKMVEDDLSEQLYNYATKVTKIKKRLTPTAEAPAQASQKQVAPNQEQPLKTLTNNVGTSRKLSTRERAMLAFKGQL